jgi:hypothetical protein
MKEQKRMAKLITMICFLLIVFSNISEAAEICVIKTICTYSIIPILPPISFAITSETSRTQQATYEASMLVFGRPPDTWDGSCYHSFSFDFDPYCCQDGNWYLQYYMGGVWVSGYWDVYCGEDGDNDGIPDYIDNCPEIPNGPGLGTCVPGSAEAGAICQSNADCGGDLCSKTQEDTDSDGIGDVCDSVPASTTTTVLPTTTTTSISSTTTTVPPTVVELSSFTATPSNRAVILEWQTASEIDTTGFNLYRAAAEDGAYTKINAALIPAKGSSTEGAAYEFVDKDVKNRKTYWYKLEDVDLNGTSTMHGPITATPRLIFGLRD